MLAFSLFLGMSHQEAWRFGEPIACEDIDLGTFDLGRWNWEVLA